MAPQRVFQIGFNKCATTSLHKFFRENGYRAISWSGCDRGERDDVRAESIAVKALKNQQEGKLLFDGMDYQVFSDMEWVTEDEAIYLYEKFELIDQQYPGSKFILNTRSVEDWITSRCNHRDPWDGWYLRVQMKYYGKTADQVKELWREHFYKHIHLVKAYFKDPSKQSQLLHFELKKTTAKDIVDFLPEWKFEHAELPHIHKTNWKRRVKTALKRIG